MTESSCHKRGHVQFASLYNVLNLNYICDAEYVQAYLPKIKFEIGRLMAYLLLFM